MQEGVPGGAEEAEEEGEVGRTMDGLAAAAVVEGDDNRSKGLPAPRSNRQKMFSKTERRERKYSPCPRPNESG